MWNPRVGGEKGLNPALAAYNGGSPPHGRGKVFFDQKKASKARITPAWAGKRGTSVELVEQG